MLACIALAFAGCVTPDEVALSHRLYCYAWFAGFAVAFVLYLALQKRVRPPRD